MRDILRPYRNLEKHIIYLLFSEFFLQLINASFLLILNIYMSKHGYADFRIADFTSYRYLAVLLLAFPLGLFIKGRRLKPLFYTAAIGLPITSLIIVYAVALQIDAVVYISFGLWGIFYTFQQVTIIPYIVRNANPETQSEAISLKYAGWSIATIFTGLAIYILNKFNALLFDEEYMLLLFSLMGLLAVYCIYKMDIKENVPVISTKRSDLHDFNWSLIIKALIPNFIIAVGAGLAMPFMNLFFYTVHNIGSEQFSLLGSVSAVLVTIGFVIVPFFKRNYGYTIAITLFQSMAVAALYIMASTDFFTFGGCAAAIAVVAFILRQPLMNMAGPMASELMMNYVGTKNQEMVSALNSAIVSGCWYISARIFKQMREHDCSYGYVLLTTAIIYTVGTVWYQMLINEHHKKVSGI
jgi:MFS family permease